MIKICFQDTGKENKIPLRHVLFIFTYNYTSKCPLLFDMNLTDSQENFQRRMFSKFIFQFLSYIGVLVTMKTPARAPHNTLETNKISLHYR